MPLSDDIVETVNAIARHGACAHSRKLLEGLLADQVKECAEVARSVEVYMASTGRTEESRTAAHIATAIQKLAD
jgi:hypothetical protein